MRYIITEGKCKWADLDTEDTGFYAMHNVIKFFKESAHPEDFYILFEDGRKIPILEWEGDTE